MTTWSVRLALAALMSTTPAVNTVPQDTRTAAKGPSLMMQALYATTVMMQGLDAQSTLRALEGGARERNPLMAPLVNDPAAFVGTKMAVAGLLIYASHALSGEHKRVAAVVLIAANVCSALVVQHNYQIVYHLARSTR